MAHEDEDDLEFKPPGMQDRAEEVSADSAVKRALAELQKSDVEEVPGERRKSPRVSVVIPIKLPGDGSGESFNVSSSGMGLFADQTFEVGSEIEVLLPSSEDGDLLPVKAIVRWNRPNDSMGLEFVDIDPALAKTLASLIHTAVDSPDDVL